VIDDLEGEPVLLVDTEAVEAKLESVPWVESARVRTDFPHTVFIDIRERRPVASFQWQRSAGTACSTNRVGCST
jgi:cell division protein FtsQ